MNTVRYAFLLVVMLTPALVASMLSASQVTWLAHMSMFVPGHDYFLALGTRHALEELISTGVTLLCTIALFVACLASRPLHSSFVRMRANQGASRSLTSVRARLVALGLVGLVVFAWTCPEILLHDPASGLSGVLSRLFDRSSFGLGIYLDGLMYLTVWVLLVARMVFLPGRSASEAALWRQDPSRRGP